jgi:hypothetical protein
MSGLAGEIRNAIENEQFDLGGYTEPRITQLVQAAFGTPLSGRSEMIRLTFVVGGGKLVRSRYPEELPKWMATALRDIGYVEDRSAACTLECQGMFKQQHDTGQNLKTLMVFPRLEIESSSMKRPMSAPAVDEPTKENPSSEKSIIISCSLEELEKYTPMYLTSWRQKKRAQKFLQESLTSFTLLEGKLVRGEPLDAAEQAQYDQNAGRDVNAEKVAWLQQSIKHMVDSGELTSSEKAELVATQESTLKSLAMELAAACTIDDVKKKDALQKKQQHLLTRAAFVHERMSTRSSPYQLRHHEEIVTLRLQLLPLQLLLAEKEGSMSLTLTDLKTLTAKPILETKIRDWEAKSREWFEEPAEFDAKCQLAIQDAERRFKRISQNANNNNKSKSNLSSSSKLKNVPATTGKRSSDAGSKSAWSCVPMNSKKNSVHSHRGSSKTSSGFAAAFGHDSSSDDSSDDG